MSMGNKKTIVVNLYGGPGTGKSTTAAGLFYKLKTRGVNSEMAREYAKNVVWKEAYSVLHDQLYIFAKQNNILHYLDGKVDVVVTDSPLLLSMIYGNEESETFHKFVLEKYNKYENINVFLKRQKKFEPAGRMQTEEQAKQIDTDIKDILNDNGFDYVEVLADETAPDKIMDIVSKSLEFEEIV